MIKKISQVFPSEQVLKTLKHFQKFVEILKSLEETKSWV